MLGFNKIKMERLRRQEARLIAEMKFMDRMKAKMPQYFALKLLKCVSDLADVEYQIKMLEDRYGTA